MSFALSDAGDVAPSEGTILAALECGSGCPPKCHLVMGQETKGRSVSIL